MNEPRALSYWDLTRLQQPVDTLIIGGGITGLSCARRLAELEPNSSIRIVDQFQLTRVASTRNAGFVCFGSLTEIEDDTRHFGRDVALSLVEQRYRGMKMIAETLDHKKIDYRRTGGFELIDEQAYVESGLEEKRHQLNEDLKPIFQKKVFHRLEEKRFSFHPKTVVIENPFEGQLNPAFYVNVLHRSLPQEKVEYMSGIRVEDFELIGDAYRVSTSQGDMQARSIVVATNSLANNLLSMNEKIKPTRNIVMVSEQFRVPFQGIFHAEDGYIYFRNIGSDRMLIGGGRHRDIEREYTDDFGINDKVVAGLRTYLQDRVFFNDTCPDFEHTWSGIMGMTSNKTPVIKHMADRLFVAAGFSGMGVALGMNGGCQIAELVSKSLFN